MHSPKPYHEKELLNRISAGDDAAFTQLFDEYYPSLSTHIFNITRSFPLTQEIVQDIFLKIWMSRETLTDVNNIRSYLWVMAKNHALNALLKVARERTNRAKYIHETVFVAQERSDNGNIYLTLIDEAIANLPPQQQKVYLLSRRERLKQAEIADEMGIAITTVKKYLQLATEFIKNYVLQRISLTFPIAGMLFLSFI